MILIVDSDVASSARLERLLKYHGFEAAMGATGMEALALLELRSPKLIVMEIDLKDMDGMLLLKSIRVDPQFMGVPIIVYSNTFADEQRREALRNGAQAFLVKGTLGWGAVMEWIEALYPKA